MTTLSPTPSRPDSLAQPWYALYLLSTQDIETALRETSTGSRQYLVEFDDAPQGNLIWTDNPEHTLSILREGGITLMADEQFVVLETTARRTYRVVTGLLKHNGVSNVAIQNIATVLQAELVETEMLDQQIMTEVARYAQNPSGHLQRLDGPPQWAETI